MTPCVHGILKSLSEMSAYAGGNLYCQWLLYPVPLPVSRYPGLSILLVLVGPPDFTSCAELQESSLSFLVALVGLSPEFWSGEFWSGGPKFSVENWSGRTDFPGKNGPPLENWSE